jgi:hypothetical protein
LNMHKVHRWLGTAIKLILVTLVCWMISPQVFDDYSSNHPRRVFSPGFIMLCTLVVVFELLLLQHLYGHRS